MAKSKLVVVVLWCSSDHTSSAVSTPKVKVPSKSVFLFSYFLYLLIFMMFCHYFGIIFSKSALIDSITTKSRKPKVIIKMMSLFRFVWERLEIFRWFLCFCTLFDHFGDTKVHRFEIVWIFIKRIFRKHNII